MSSTSRKSPPSVRRGQSERPLSHRDAGRNERPSERVNREGELFERDSSEKQEASGGSEKAGSVKRPAVNGDQKVLIAAYYSTTESSG